MLIPVRCFTCGKVIGNKYETYISLQTVKGVEPSEALNTLGKLVDIIFIYLFKSGGRRKNLMY
jgi:hypothetical protein